MCYNDIIKKELCTHNGKRGERGNMEITGFESKIFRDYCDEFKIDNVRIDNVKIVNEIKNVFFNSCNDIEEIALKSVSLCSGIMVIEIYFNDRILNTIIMDKNLHLLDIYTGLSITE